MGKHSSSNCIISISSSTWTSFPGILKPWSMACHHFCIYPGCQCGAGMGIASAARLSEQLSVDLHDRWSSYWCICIKSILQPESIYKL